MRRRLSHRQKWPLHLGLFLVYIIIQLATSSYSASTSPPELGVPTTVTQPATQKPTSAPAEQKKEVTEAPKAVEQAKEKPKVETTPSPKTKDSSKDKASEPAVKKEANATANSTQVLTTAAPRSANPTWRPKRANCSPPAIEQFPRPVMGPGARKHGGLIIHILVAVYTFLGLAIVCDDYFVASLDRICEELRLTPDVAGATFMAAGSSAPELATVIIGVFFAKDDIGVSGVIGSAVFNIMFVISVCGLCTTTVSKLNWWPLCRDSFFYFISILIMLGTISNEIISWPESLIMLIMYGVYCVVLSYNSRLERWAKSYNIPFLPKDDEPAEESALVNPNEVSPLEKPTEGGQWALFKWGLVYPIHYTCRATMPDCRQEKWRSWYPFTFCISMIWISFYRSTLGIPDTVMGLTFVAAGVSVPDALSSLAVIKEGLGDMAVSNAVGSNVFDILVCLGLPWFIQTAMIQPGSHVNVTIVATHLNGWKLDRRYGVILMVWYLIFIVFASLYELNVFGQMNPPVCPSVF
ncbi:Similar to CG1090: Probable sodium/potassium/calcium exchanger CG1090 (Drosophila melanogaster) [Cotesia congregata]|uniref:Similar to CG1090: Probable sodium/potassium/calcium exchanger CG1090 (Drosophila melanogaster) n=1 Tax=Cotesia congregata TaxID=51543 RepID=A0A8J2EP40_COTCN|nr:Similar to CG1090: Probable sodium/potassium/calcium exchanger CG1090 (Drosophila melanogaster) [Cotesia congregata]